MADSRIDQNATNQNISAFSKIRNFIKTSKSNLEAFLSIKTLPDFSKKNSATGLEERNCKTIPFKVNYPNSVAKNTGNEILSTKVSVSSPLSSNDSSVKIPPINGEGGSRYETSPVNENNSSSDAENAAKKDPFANVDISDGQKILESAFEGSTALKDPNARRPYLLMTLSNLNPNISADVLIFVLGNETALKRLNELASGSIKILTNNILKALAKNSKPLQDKLDPLQDKLDPATAEKLLNFVLENEKALEQLNKYGANLLNDLLAQFYPLTDKLDFADAEETLQSLLKNNQLNDLDPKLRDALLGSLTFVSATKILEFVLEDDDMCKRLNDLDQKSFDALVDKLPSSHAEFLLKFALLRGERWDRLNEYVPKLRNALVRRMNSNDAKKLLEFVLLDAKKLERLNDLDPESLKSLVDNLDDSDTAWILKSALLDAKIWDRLNKFGPNLRDALVRRVNSDTDNDPLELLKSAFNRYENLDNLNDPGMKFLNDLVAKLGKKGKFHLNDGKLEFVPADA
jgi:hypothetical protein